MEIVTSIIIYLSSISISFMVLKCNVIIVIIKN